MSELTELRILMSKLATLAKKDETIKKALQSIVRANEILLAGISFPDEECNY